MSEPVQSPFAFETLDSATLRALLAETQDLHREIWESPGKLGVNSELLSKAAAHYNKVFTFASPSNMQAAAEYREILGRSWFVLWRARDYSVRGWEARIRQSNLTRSSHFNHLLEALNRNAKLYEDGTHWYPSHYPPYSMEGALTPNEWRGWHHILGAVDMRHYTRAISFFSEGAIISHGSFYSNVEPGGRRLDRAFICASGSECVVPGSDLSDCYVRPKLSLSPSFSAARTIFSSDVKIEDPNSIETLPFRYCKFLSRLEVSNTTLSGDESEVVQIPETTDFGDVLILSKVSCQERLIVPASIGLHALNLRDCSAQKGIEFAPRDARAPLALQIERGEFVGVSARDLVFSSISVNSVFYGKIDFSSSSFIGVTNFQKTKFHGEITFENCEFGSKQSKHSANFNSVQFLTTERYPDSNVTFFGSIFHQPGLFKNSKFAVRTFFSGVQFHREVDFDDAQFDRRIAFGGPLGASVFHKTASFKATKNSTQVSFAAVNFDGCRFHQRVNFSNRIFANSTRFEHARFEELAIFHGASLHEDTSFRGASFKPRRAVWRSFRFFFSKRLAVWRRICLRVLPFSQSSLSQNPNIHSEAVDLVNSALKERESAFRTLRHAMEKNQDHRQAAIFHSNELKSRHARFGDEEVSRAEAWFGWAYGLLANYGESITRPVIAFFLVLFATTGSFYALAPEIPGGVRTPFTAAYDGQVRPFYYQSPAFGRAAASSDYGGCLDEIIGAEIGLENEVPSYCFAIKLLNERPGWFRLVTFFQSFGVAITLFLVLLSIRRKLQLH